MLDRIGVRLPVRRAPQPRDLARRQLDCAPFLDFADAEAVLFDHLVECVPGSGFGFGQRAVSGGQGCANLDGELFELGFAFASQADALGVGLLDRLSGGDLVGVAGHHGAPFILDLAVTQPKPDVASTWTITTPMIAEKSQDHLEGQRDTQNLTHLLHSRNNVLRIGLWSTPTTTT